MKPICVKCERFYRAKKTGYYFLEGMPTGAGVPPGRAEPTLWKPYKLWCGDLYECPDCGAQIIVGVPTAHPIDEHYTATFADRVQRLGADQLLVKDC